MKTKSSGRIITILFFFTLVSSACATPGMRSNPILQKIGPKDSLLLTTPDGTVRLSKNAEVPRIPASTLKVLTALAALHFLGKDFCFKTAFYLDKNQDLVIKGYGDPFLVSERVAAIAGRLAEKFSSIHDILIDDSFVEQSMRVPGADTNSFQPYDAPNGALCVNFNTVYYKREHGKYVSAEPQTPLLPMAIQRIRKNGLKSGRILLTTNEGEAARYAGEMFAFFLRKKGVKVSGKVRTRLVNPASGRLIHTACSPALTEIIQKIFRFSNNFMANQVLLATGARAYGEPATIKNGVRAVSAYAASELAIHPVLVEGSGISRANRISATMFLKVLERFRRYHGLLKHTGRIFYKTGTLSDVRNMVGYIQGKKGLYPFVIFINTPGNMADKILKKLEKVVPQKGSDLD